jgi:3-hydroxybutyryl-CoA dehydratase
VNDVTASSDLFAPGYELPVLVRTMTAERMRWYADVLDTAAAGSSTPIIAEPNIHTDDDLARANGLPARVADGMVSTNWIHTLLADTYGLSFLAGGSLRTRYVRPIFLDERIEVVVRVTGRERDPDGGERLVVDVQCVKADGQVATGGTATVRVPPEHTTFAP